ncbi:hypothetical protein MRX96_022194 [Rhipicephalus microplus]
MAQELLAEADSLIPCKGFGEKGVFAANPKRQEKTCGGKTFSMSCPGVAQELGKACPQCRYLRKLLLNQASYKRRKAHACTRPLSYKLKIWSMQLKRTKSKILRVKLNIEKLKRKNASEDSSVFVDAIKSLPSKQQQQPYTGKKLAVARVAKGAEARQRTTARAMRDQAGLLVAPSIATAYGASGKQRRSRHSTSSSTLYWYH